ncbi:MULTISPECIES: hypothetical protein [unclassified Nocardioides]|uniref:hypothetical protein n=1 Tax=unclassified Nocardioides TaxID=2615069 RepID=UPI0006FC1236|nr:MULTISPECIES: hypothetical protein [unclassified Nocardioides]KRA38958.1 hypothetical protein ASD81_10360 [Nocardioides sp. Root614]KRA92917.1 hypothetical protein ASD84_10625 [Nocardioides sp. Root682]
MNTTTADWQGQAVAGLSQLTPDAMPAMELLYLDGLAVHLLGPDAPAPPYTIEHGATIASLLLRALADAPVVELDLEPGDTDGATATARAAIVDGAHRLARSGGLGAQRLVKRFLPAAVGELEQHKEGPEAQVRSLFYYGLLAIASGPENQTNAETSDGVLASFRAWDERIGAGFVPPWRIIDQESTPA